MKDPYAVDIRFWDERVQEAIYTSNPIVYELIEKGINKNDRFMLVSYHFLENLFASGELYLPGINGQSLPYHPVKSPKYISDFIGRQFSMLPFSLVTKGYFEVYWDASDKVIPKSHLTKGKICGLRTFLSRSSRADFKYAWTAKAGARTLALIPSIKDKEKFKKLKLKYAIQAERPNGFKEHAEVFKAIYDAAPATTWKSELLFFSNKTAARMKTDDCFNHFRRHIYKNLWSICSFDGNQSSFDFIWGEFIRNLEKMNFKQKDYIYNLSKYLILVAIGREFAFSPAISNEVGPLKQLRSIFLDDYKLKYIPSFIYADHFGSSSNYGPLYYSLQYPIHLNPYPLKRTANSGLDDLRDVKEIHERFFDYIAKSQSEYINESFLAAIANQIKFDYFHTVKDGLKSIAQCADMINLDARFLEIDNNGSNLSFCSSSSFFRGCIKIERNF